MNITVYLGSRLPDDKALVRAARELGAWIGLNRHRLIYGGSKCGLMGVLSESVLQAGGEVTGVEPQFFIDCGFEYNEISELIVTKDIAGRKAKMIELGDAFIAFPGGTGTLEEISEVMSKICMGDLNAPCIVYNINGYYNALKAQLIHMVESGLADKKAMKRIVFAKSLVDVEKVFTAMEKRSES